MRVLQISKQGLPTEVMELVGISEPDAPKAGGLLAAIVASSSANDAEPGHLAKYREVFGDRCHLAVSLHHGTDDDRELDRRLSPAASGYASKTHHSLELPSHDDHRSRVGGPPFRGERLRRAGRRRS